MTENSKHEQQCLDSDTNASQCEKPIFSQGCGPLSDCEIVLLKKSAQQTAREAQDAEFDEMSPCRGT
jgi:hypothetical protein